MQELANIAQDQVKVIEHYNRYQDFEYDSLQRRILELQSLSDEKMIIGKEEKIQQNIFACVTSTYTSLFPFLFFRSPHERTIITTAEWNKRKL